MKILTDNVIFSDTTNEKIRIDLQAQLSALDVVLPRCVEDLISLIEVGQELPQIMKDRLAEKQALRQQLRELLA